MRPKELKQLLKAQLKQGSNLDNEIGSVFIWGPPGIGKSQIVENVAKEEEAGAIDFRLLLNDPSDLKGIPVPINDNGVWKTFWVPPSQLPREGIGFLFFDDFPDAPPLVQGCAYQIAIRPHQLGEYKLPEGWVIVGAGNKVGQGGLAHRMPRPLCNRFTHVELEVNLDDWTAWAIKNDIEADIIAFNQFKPSALFDFDPKRQEEAFPTPRSWETVSKHLKYTPRAVLHETIEGTVGKGAAAELREFQKVKNELPDLDQILNGKLDFVPQRSDLRYALVSGLATRAKSKQFDNMLKYASLLPAEFGVLLIKLLSAKDKDSLAMCPSWPSWVKKHKDFLVG